MNPVHPQLHDACSMGDLVVRAIQRGGDRVAFILDDQSITYREFGVLLGRFIRALAERGVRKGDAIAALSSNRPEAFMASAAAYVMGLRITWMHPLGSEDDHAYILEDAGIGTLFVDPDGFADRAFQSGLRRPTESKRNQGPDGDRLDHGENPPIHAAHHRA